LNQEKDYYSAINSYEKVIEVNPTSYPTSYFNIALMAAQIKDYNHAILNMKKYLLLVPDLEDARAAKDKIYEWELVIER
jgi:tetratricopeptide (TPR) repeat protein